MYVKLVDKEIDRATLVPCRPVNRDCSWKKKKKTRQKKKLEITLPTQVSLFCLEINIPEVLFLVFSLDRIGVSQFIYFYSKWLLLCHKLLKYEPCYDLQSKMFWHSGFKIFKTRISWLRIWSYTELMRVSLCKFFNKIFTKFWENDRFLRIFLYIYLQKSAHSFQSFTKCFSRSNHRRCS